MNHDGTLAIMRTRPLALLILGVVSASCGGTQSSSQEQLTNLRRAMQEEVRSAEDNQAHSRLVENIAENGALIGKTREEVRETIGAGDPCSRHERCQENDFEDNDWFYTVGRSGSGFSGQAPILIVGFDRTGRADRTWNLRVH